MLRIKRTPLTVTLLLASQREFATPLAHIQSSQTDTAGTVLHTFEPQPAIHRCEQADRPGILAVGKALGNPDLMGTILDRLTGFPPRGGNCNRVILLEEDLRFIGAPLIEVNEATVITRQLLVHSPGIGGADQPRASDLEIHDLGTDSRGAGEIPVAGGSRIGEDSVRGLGIVSDHVVVHRRPGRDSRSLGDPTVLTEQAIANAERLLRLIGSNCQSVVVLYTHTLPDFCAFLALCRGCGVDPFPMEVVLNGGRLGGGESCHDRCEQVMFQPGDWND